MVVVVPGRWECPWHQCDICGKEAASFCEMCPSSYCKEHRDGMLFISKLDGKLSCSEHDPCGPEPLEPGEIREYMPNMTSVRPRNLPPPISMVPVSESSSPVPSASLAAEPRPPPRLYINTKTATSSFVPFNRSYLTDEGDEKPASALSSSSFSSTEEREDGEVEDGEVCQLEVEEDDDEDDEEEEEDDDNETGEMEIVEEEELLYSGDLLEDDNKEDTGGGNVFDDWSDYIDDDEDGEVEDEDDDEWRMVVDEDK